MKLFIVSTEDYGYDEFDSHVIAAKTDGDAKKLAKLPGDQKLWKVEEIGTYKEEKAGIVHSSFNAG